MEAPTSTRQAQPASLVVQRRIEWPDTDASGWWHNTAGFRFIEVAETALLERLGILDDVYGRLPRVHISADYRASSSFAIYATAVSPSPPSGGARSPTTSR